MSLLDKKHINWIMGGGGVPSSRALFQAVGTGVGAADNVTFSWPTHETNDIALALIETLGNDGDVMSAPSGWTEVSGSPSDGSVGSTRAKLQIFWKRATSSSEADFTTTYSSPNHVYGIILTMRGCLTSASPIDVTNATQKGDTTTACSIAGVTATENGNDVLYVAAYGFDNPGPLYSSPINANLTSLTERTDGGTNLGNGGGIAAWTGNLATAGPSGTLTATISQLTNESYLCISFKGN